MLLHRLGAQLAANDLEQAAETALGGLPLAASSAALSETLVQVLDRAAHATATAGTWERAGSLWEAAREVVSANSGLGSPRPLLHNVALAYEAQERWSEAAEAWRAMLRTQPRKATARSQGSEGGDQAVEANPQGLSDAQWAWVRGRVIECYKRAGTPGEAVALFRQALKAAPDDIETRLQLVDALFGNEQEQAALNELGRILQIDPHHVDAQLRLANLRSGRGEWHAAEQVLRNVLAQHPEREDVRRQMARLLLSHGMELHQWGNRAGAARLFEEGRRFAPDDYQFPLNLGRIAIDERKPNKARPLLERALELAPDQPAAYISVIDCWAVADKIDEARAVLSRAEAVFPPSPEFYVPLATMLLNRSAPLPMILPFAPAPPAVPANSAWSQLATEMLDKAVALRPGDPQLRRQIAATLMLRQPELALPYAEEAAQLAPDDPEMLLVLGLALGLNERTREAKETLRRTARSARQQGRPEIAEEAEDLRRQVGSPFLRASLQMAQMANEIGLDLDDLYL